jgi:hypothetical protein
MTSASPPPAAADPAAEIAALSRDSSFLAGNPAAVARMFALHEAAQQGGFPGAGESNPAAPAPSSPGTPAAPGGRFKPEDYTLEMIIDAKASPAATVAIQTEARQLAAALDLEPELARGGSEILDKAIASRAGKPMDAAELNRLDTLLGRQLGPDLNAALARFEARLKAAGPHGDTMRRLIVASGPEAAAWAVASLGAPR